jgi:hypothetical protein
MARNLIISSRGASACETKASRISTPAGSRGTVRDSAGEASGQARPIAHALLANPLRVSEGAIIEDKGGFRFPAKQSRMLSHMNPPEC